MLPLKHSTLMAIFPIRSTVPELRASKAWKPARSRTIGIMLEVWDQLRRSAKKILWTGERLYVQPKVKRAKFKTLKVTI